MYTEPCVSEKYFTNRKFVKEAEGIFSRKETRTYRNPYTQQHAAVERTVKFKIHNVDPDHGTNIEFFIDNHLQLSGYWTDEQDFVTDFKL